MFKSKSEITRKMDKKEIDSLIKELEAQYPTDERFRKGIEQIASNLSSLPEKDLNHILDQIKERYKGYSETKSNLKAAREGLEEISKNIQQIGKNYGLTGRGAAEIVRTMGNIAEKASEIDCKLREGLGELEQAKANIDKTSTLLHKVKQALTQAESYLKEYQKSKEYEPATTDTKKLN